MRAARCSSADRLPRPGVEGAEVAGGRPFPHQPFEIRDGIAPDLLLGLGIGLGEEAPMGGRDPAGPHLRPDMVGRQDIEEREAFDAARMIEREPVSDPCAAIMPGDSESTWPRASMTSMTSRPMARLE